MGGVFNRDLAALLDPPVEYVVCGVEHVDIGLAVLVRPGPHRIAHILLGRVRGQQRHRFDPDLVQQILEDKGLRDDADGSGDAGGLGDDVVGAAGDVVAAGGGEPAEACDHRDPRVAHPLDLVPDLVRCRDAATGRVDPQDRGLGAAVTERLVDKGADDVRPMGVDHAFDGDDGHGCGVTVAVDLLVRAGLEHGARGHDHGSDGQAGRKDDAEEKNADDKTDRLGHAGGPGDDVEDLSRRGG